MTTFCEIAAHSFNSVFSLIMSTVFVIMVVSHFGFEGGTVALIAPVPGYC